MKVKWETWKGDKFSGEVVEVDGNVLHVRTNDGDMKAVEANGCELAE